MGDRNGMKGDQNVIEGIKKVGVFSEVLHEVEELRSQLHGSLMPEYLTLDFVKNILDAR